MPLPWIMQTELEFYSDKKKVFKALGQAVIIVSVCFIILTIFNYLSARFIQFIALPFILGAPVFVALIIVYRNIMLTRYPTILIHKDHIRYFSALWYTKHRWETFDSAWYSDHEKLLILTVGEKVKKKINLENFNREDIEQILNAIKSRKEVILT